MNNSEKPAARQVSPSKVVVEVPALGVRMTVYFKPIAISLTAAPSRSRKANGQFDQALPAFAQAAE